MNSVRIPTPRLGLTLLATILCLCSNAQSLGDHRSVASGNWNLANTWERFDGTNFLPAPSAPSLTDGVITIQAGHTVTANTAITADQVQVDVGGTLLVSGSTFGLANGPGNDLVVNGSFEFTGGNFAGPGTAFVASGGTFTWTGGTIGNSAILDLGTGSTSTFTNAGKLS